MLFAGVAWSERGFAVEIVDDEGSSAAPSRRFTGGQLSSLVEHLTGCAVAVESTNGVLDGSLMDAGLLVRRVDPAGLPPRPPFGSAPAAVLAECARRGQGTELTRAGGSLTGRDRDADAAAETAGPRLEHARRDRPVVALTFDDGPHPRNTTAILDVLDRHRVPATFFCVGVNTIGQAELVARVAERGHEIANHTWSHPFLPDLTAAEAVAQLARTRDALGEITGATTRWVRPTYGAISASVERAWAAQPETVVCWDVDSNDWATPGVAAIVGNVLGAVRPGSVILMHDGGGDRSQTAAALPEIIEGCRALGLDFARMSDCQWQAR